MSTTIQALLANAKNGRFGAVHLLVGEETILRDRAVVALRRASIGSGIAGLNEDTFHGSQATASAVLSAARTLAMMSPVRFVLVRGVDAMKAEELDAIAAYVEDPSSSTCLVMTADKLDGRGKLSKIAKKTDVLVEVARLKGAAVAGFAQSEARARGHALGPDATSALLDSVGDDLAAIEDAIERLSLFVGAGASIDVAAIDACVARLRTESIWALVDALGMRDARKATHALVSLLADQEPPLRIVAMISRQFRMIAKAQEALRSGASRADAAQLAGAPPFKADELARAADRSPPSELRRIVTGLARLDRSLKSSRVQPDVLMVEAVTSLAMPARA